MATVEFIQKRIEGKEKEIAKLEKKMERILKAKESNWENNPYYYHEDDIKWTSRDLEDAKKALEGYKAQMVAETEKANSRNITAIIEFLNAWKERMTGFYHEQYEMWKDAREEWGKFDREFCEWSNQFGWKTRKENPDEYKRIRGEYDDRKKEYTKRWSFLFGYIDGRDFNEEKFQKDLQRDADAKYDFIIERTNAIVGTITDASNLRIGAKGDLNGFIIGEKGKARVETIGAGGYNIQCYHFRTLIHKMK